MPIPLPLMSFRPLRAVARTLLLCGAALAVPEARAGWSVVKTEGSGPLRSIVRRADGRLMGPRSSGTAIDVWISDDGGIRWRRHGEVARNPGVAFGDPMFLAVPGTDTVFCAAREHSGKTFRVTVYRSDDGGDRWDYDSAVDASDTRFVGAPFLFLRANGDLQCYYDSEPLAAENGRPGFQWIAMRGRSGLSGGWDHYGLVTVSREHDPSTLTRDGMPSVVDLGGDRLLCFTEGVETRGRGAANVIRVIESADGGRTWDTAGRRIVYESRVDPDSGRQFNAYAPWAIRLADGSIVVAFCTDEGFDGPPDASHEVVPKRRSHIKVVRASAPYRSWSGPETVWDRSTASYVPGLFERSPGDLICAIDLLNGHQAVIARTVARTLSDALRAVVSSPDATADAAFVVPSLRAMLGLNGPEPPGDDD